MLKWNTMRRFGRGLLLGGALVALPWMSLAAGGDVLSAHGPVQTSNAGGARDLVAGDRIEAGDQLVAGATGGAALAVGDLWVEVGPNTDLRLEADGSVAVTRGTARVVDLAHAGGTIRTPHAVLQVGGSDTEVLVEADRSEACERRREIRVAPLTDERHPTATPVGRCAVAQAGALTLSAAGAERLQLSGAQVDVAIASHFVPTDVAAPAPNLDLFPLDPDKRTYLPCDDPGSCGGALTVLQAPTAPRTPPRRRTRTVTPGFTTGPANP